jgi:hypothetical protein
MLRAVVVAAALTTVGAAQAFVIDFEDITGADYGSFIAYGDEVQTQGFVFESELYQGFDSAIASWTDETSYYTGSIAIFANYYDDVLKIYQASGDPFSLFSVDLADVYLAQESQTVTFYGTRADSSTVTESFYLADGTSLNTFYFADMTDVVEVEVWTDSWWYQMDNLNVVPEPASLAVLGLGALALLRRRR